MQSQLSRATAVRPQAFFKKSSSVAVAEKPSTTTKGKKTTSGKATELPKQSIMEALDFSQVRSKRDAELLYEAKYGQRAEDGKMSREQYQALRRKIGGTAKDYWKDWVEDEMAKNVQTYYKPGEAAAVPYLPFLVGVVGALVVATVVVVEKTA